MRINKKAAGIVAGVAAITALSGTGSAVAGGLITANQIAKNAVTGEKVKDNTLTLKDFKSSERSKLAGPQGPAGPAGPAGVGGLPGPAGAAATLNTVTVESPDVTVPPGAMSTVIAYCPAGKKALGGGYFASIANVGASMPTGSATGLPATSWGVIVHNQNSIPVDANAYVICA